MQDTSLRRMACLGFFAPMVIVAGAIVSVALGRGQAVMLPSTTAALVFYGALIAVGVAWSDRAATLFQSKRKYVVCLSAMTLVLSVAAWLDATHGVLGLFWRPLLTAAVCLWLGVIVASIVPRRTFT